MTTTTIIVAVLAGLFLLIAVTFTLQQLEKNNREKSALIASLKAQARNFRFMLDGFPEGLLNRDLKLLVCQCIAENTEQLLRVDRRDAQALQWQREINEKMTQLQAQPNTPGQYQVLTDAAQMQDVQKLLTSLFNVVQQLHKSKRLNQEQASNYAQQVLRLNTRIAVDANVAAAQNALQTGKPRVAAHYFGVAVDKMNKDNADNSYTAQIAAFTQRRAELEALDTAQQNKNLGNEWGSVAQPAEEPLKKSVYD
ncbi:MAG: hypothetical protein JWM78_2563 [Verrucomicrobiaceae bacterium]|nr:hypothetical protein [Verrucomicrobiaceae bacterium]